MTSLEWNLLAEKFYAFKIVADKFGFYVPETNGMEQSLSLMRPYPGDNEKAKELAEEKKDLSGIPYPEWLETWTPEYDDDDKMVKA